MDEVMAVLASNGATIEAIIAAAHTIEIDPEFAAALRELKAIPCTRLLIISDANQLFIEEILRANGLADTFAPILTNFSTIVPFSPEAAARRREPDGGTAPPPPAPTRLKIEPYVRRRWAPHVVMIICNSHNVVGGGRAP